MPATGEAADVRSAQAGDHGAFERLYRRHVGRVYALAVRLAEPEMADDLTQEVFIRAWRKLDTFRGRSRFGTWLHRLAVNHILSRRRTESRRDARRVAGDGLLARLAAPKGRSSGAALDLEQAIRTLPPRARSVFVLYDVEGYTHDEIAAMLGVSQGTSKSQLHRARMLLRDRLG